VPPSYLVKQSLWKHAHALKLHTTDFQQKSNNCSFDNSRQLDCSPDCNVSKLCFYLYVKTCRCSTQILTRSSAVAESSRDAPCRWKRDTVYVCFFYLWPCLIDSRLALSSWNFQNRPPIAQKSCHSIRQVAASCSGERDESRVQQLTGLIGLSIRPAYVRPYSCWTAFIVIQ